jgi:uncharacterized oxidoreductase
MKLDGNTILITGGASGIGLALAGELRKRGNTVIITGRDQAKLDKAKQQVPELHVIQSDVARVADIDALFAKVTEEFPKLNVLVNNAGVMRTINLNKHDGSLEDLTSEIDISLSGPIRMVRRFLPHLAKMESAAIVNVSSGLAFVPLPINPVYCAAKAGLHSFTLSLRVQLKKTRVKVFEIAPPATATELLGDPSSPDLKGVPIMKVEDMVAICLEGLARDRFEIRPGQANQLRFMNRVAPDFIFAQLSKTVDRMLAD